MDTKIIAEAVVHDYHGDLAKLAQAHLDLLSKNTELEGELEEAEKATGRPEEGLLSKIKNLRRISDTWKKISDDEVAKKEAAEQQVKDLREALKEIGMTTVTHDPIPAIRSIQKILEALAMIKEEE